MKLDYDRIAAEYDRHRHGGGPYLDRLAALARQCGGNRVLEVGSGTGNNSRLFQAMCPCRFFALESSRGMLEQARGKGVQAGWVRGAAPDFPFADGSFDFLFATYVLHHIRDIDRLFRECLRVLSSGCAAFVTAPQSFILRHPMNTYFTSFAAIDLARFQPIEQVTASLRAAGFDEVNQEHFVFEPRPVDAAYVARVAGKFISTYDLIPSEEFLAGLARLRADVAARGALETRIEREATLVWGWKPR
jgi:ubiquinone/menaquinone biosynthesis C-methylase UbiE